MNPVEPSSEHHGHAERLRELRLKLAATGDEPERHIILREIERLEEEAKDQLRP